MPGNRAQRRGRLPRFLATLKPAVGRWPRGVLGHRDLRRALGLSTRAEHSRHVLRRRRQLLVRGARLDTGDGGYRSHSAVYPPRVANNNSRRRRADVTSTRQCHTKSRTLEVDREVVKRKRSRHPCRDRKQRRKLDRLTRCGRLEAVGKPVNGRRAGHQGARRLETRQGRIPLEHAVHARNEPWNR